MCRFSNGYQFVGKSATINFSVLAFKSLFVVVVRIFNATRYPWHIEAAAIVMCMLCTCICFAFMDHPCTLSAAVCHQMPTCPHSTQGTLSMS